MPGELIYLDSSALVKLVVREAESEALRRFLRSRPRRVSSIAASVELPRAVRRAGGTAAFLRRAAQVLAGVTLLALDDEVARRAARLEPPTLRSLDAIHLSSALSLGSDLEFLVGYDERLAAAAAKAGLAVAAPA